MIRQRSLFRQTTFKSVKLFTNFAWATGLCFSLLGCFRLEMQIEDILALSSETTLYISPRDEVIQIGALKLRSDYYLEANLDGAITLDALSLFSESPSANGHYQVKSASILAGNADVILVNSQDGTIHLRRLDTDTENATLLLSIEDDQKKMTNLQITARWIRSPFTWRGHFSKDLMDGRNWCGRIDPLTHQCTQTVDVSDLTVDDRYKTTFIFDTNCFNCNVQLTSGANIGSVLMTENFNGQIDLVGVVFINALGSWRQFGGTVRIINSSAVFSSFLQVQDGLSVRGKARWNVLDQNFSNLIISLNTPPVDSVVKVMDIDSNTNFVIPSKVSIFSNRAGQVSSSDIQLLHRSDQAPLQFHNLEVGSVTQDLHFSSFSCDTNMQNCISDQYVLTRPKVSGQMFEFMI